VSRALQLEIPQFNGNTIKVALLVDGILSACGNLFGRSLIHSASASVVVGVVGADTKPEKNSSQSEDRSQLPGLYNIILS
jgi:hypothetical protein